MDFELSFITNKDDERKLTETLTNLESDGEFSSKSSLS